MDESDAILRNLNRLVNDPKLEYRHRNVCRAAIDYIHKLKEEIELSKPVVIGGVPHGRDA